jgi:ketosteroid isomerase-like protein
MTDNKRTIERYIDGFNRTDHAQILSCLTDDVEWAIPGFFVVVGKETFDSVIENEAFVGSPTVTVTRMVEEADVVVVEGTVKHQKKDGSLLNAVFCDVFEMRDARIRRLTSYLAELK